NTLQRKALAARFLKQATFGHSMDDIDALAETDLDFAAWIDDELAKPAEYHLAHYLTYPLSNLTYPPTWEIPVPRGLVKSCVWWDKVILGEDQLRQRIAWALSQIFVLGDAGSNARGYPKQWLTYYDILVRNAFGNFRDLLQEVTLSGKMGYYLTYVNNEKARGYQLPDENYAREVMQVFTIGLWLLNNDGTLILDDDGNAIPTYDNFHIAELAKVFTGLQYEFYKGIYHRPNRVDPMIVRNENRHDKTAKELVDGTILPGGRDTMVDITEALDVLFNHPNTPPFISFRLIQRFVSSNPSPQFVERVSHVFIDNGEGVRGDLGAVIKAILLDPEARDAGYMVEQGRGKLREPILKFTQLCRAFKLRSNAANKNIFWFRSLIEEFGMAPYNAPDVFNFYLPTYVPHGDIQDHGLVAPEFQILDDSTGLTTFHIFRGLIEEGMGGTVAAGYPPRPTLDYSGEWALAKDAPALIDHLDLLLTHQTMAQNTKDIIIEAVEAIPSFFAKARVQRAVLLVSISPEFATLE
ncbi:MAG: DUF1800 family protein, partial [Verrucomicrobia bacterium]|nr:DUF1800 family protein [Verrucomicrobiota bacterium]